MTDPAVPTVSPLTRLLVMLPALCFLPVVLLPPFNHDVAAVLDFSQRWLAGERLYGELMDVNPPLIFLLNLVPAALARWAGVAPVAAFQGTMLVLGVLVALACRRVARPRDIGEAAFTAALPALFLLAPGADFGQRDPLMVLLALPYLLQAGLRAEGRAEGGLLGATLLAALGFALKPYFVVIPLLVEAFVLARTRRIDLCAPVLAAAAIGYGAAIALFFPNYLALALPILTEAYLGYADEATVPLLLGQRLAKILLVLVPGTLLAWRCGGKVQVLVLAAWGAVASAMLQHKGWSYHVVPAELLTLAFCGLAVIKLLDRLGHAAPALAAGVLLGLSGAYFVFNGTAPWVQWRYARTEDAALARALDRALGQAAEGGRVLGLIGPIAPLFPALTYARATSTLPVMDLWPLDAIYRDCPASGPRWLPPERRGRAEAFLFAGVVERFAAAPPDVVVVDTRPPITECDGPFDLLGYFRRDPGFERGFAGYRLVESVGSLEIYIQAR